MTNLLRYGFLFALISYSLALPSQVLANPEQGNTTHPAAASEAPQEKLAAVLSPDNFYGPAAMGYAAAKAVPQICSKVFCYCGCDITDGHKSLLDCFTSLHGTDCHICQEEAMAALSLTREGESLAGVQKAIDNGYSSRYPFKQATPALLKYRATRLWNPITSEGGSAPKSGSGEACCAPKTDPIFTVAVTNK